MKLAADWGFQNRLINSAGFLRATRAGQMWSATGNSTADAVWVHRAPWRVRETIADAREGTALHQSNSSPSNFYAQMLEGDLDNDLLIGNGGSAVYIGSVNARRMRRYRSLIMVAAIPMTKEQVKGLANQLQQNPAILKQFVELELDIEKRLADAAAQGRWIDDPDVVLDPPKLPSMEMLVSDFLNGRYGPDHHLYPGSLIMEMRRRARLQLGLPV